MDGANLHLPEVCSLLFSDNFAAAAPGSAWSFPGGSWSQSGGVLAQTSTSGSGLAMALVSPQVFPADVLVTAEVRVDTWAVERKGSGAFFHIR
jgi:hypothetical protein